MIKRFASLEKANDREKNDIKILLEACDDEFVPPLSSRFSTKDQVFGLENGSGVEEYYGSMMEQPIIILFGSEGDLLGFLSYRNDNDVYVSTIIVSPKHRGCGYAKELYLALFGLYGNKNVTVRTWSTNDKHQKLLARLGFREHERVRNDRGEGIDTVYFIKEKPSFY